MTISARVHYACLALIELAIRRRSGQPVAASEISEATGIPGPFLVQILQSLRGAGWVKSIRGSQGGYLLTVDPAAITLLDVAVAMGCADAAPPVGPSNRKADQLLQDVWQSADAASKAVLSQRTLADIASRCAAGDEVMFYI